MFTKIGKHGENFSVRIRKAEGKPQFSRSSRGMASKYGERGSMCVKALNSSTDLL
jgi:hypothetical protein